MEIRVSVNVFVNSSGEKEVCGVFTCYNFFCEEKEALAVCAPRERAIFFSSSPGARAARLC